MASDQDSGVEGVIGRAKEAVGAATGADSVRDAGVAQQKKADKQDEVAEKAAELQRAKAQERGHAGEQARNEN